MRHFIISELAANIEEVFEVPASEVNAPMPRDSGWRIANHYLTDEFYEVIEWRSDRNHIEVEVQMKDGGNEDVAIALADVSFKILESEMIMRQAIVARTRAEKPNFKPEELELMKMMLEEFWSRRTVSSAQESLGDVSRPDDWIDDVASELTQKLGVKS